MKLTWGIASLSLITVACGQGIFDSPCSDGCPPGTVCYDSSCRSVCTGDRDCLVTERCSADQICEACPSCAGAVDIPADPTDPTPPTGPGPVAPGCSSDGQCSAGSICWQSTCVMVSSAGLDSGCSTSAPALPSTPSTQAVSLSGRSLRDEHGEFNALGTTLFWATWGYKFDRARLEQHLDWIAQNGFDYIRVLGTVGGASWEDREANPNWGDYDAVIAGLTDLAYDRYGLRIEWTIFGGDTFAPTATARRALVDRFLAMSRGREHKIILFEIANEAWANGFGGDGGLAELRCLTRRVNDNTQILVAASAWGDAVGFCQLYSGNVADIATVHFDRANNYGDGVWRPVRQPWGYPGEYPCANDLPPGANNEPIGPGSSVASDDDPQRLSMAAAITYISGLPMYVLHTGAGIRGGGAADVGRRPANIWDTSRIDEITAGLRVVKAALPAGLPNWTRHNAHWADYPFTADVNRFVRAYAATSGSDIIAAPIGMLNPVTMSAKDATTLDAINPLTGEVSAHWDLAAGQSFTLPSADAVLLRAPGTGQAVSGAGGNTLAACKELETGQSRTSQDGGTTLILQGDGNLVLYKGGAPLWASDTSAAGGAAVMQCDGNLVVYDAGGTPRWSSDTAGHDGARLEVEDGRAVIYGTDDTALWSTSGGTGDPGGTGAASDTLASGASLEKDDRRVSTDGRFTLSYQGDGNLVLYAGSTALWSTVTSGRTPGQVVMQGDGNLVVYDGSGQYRWASNTSGNPGARLVVQNDGNLVIYTTSNDAVWASNTSGGGTSGPPVDPPPDEPMEQ